MEDLIAENEYILERFTKLYELAKTVGDIDLRSRDRFIDLSCNIESRFNLFEENVRKMNALRRKQDDSPPDYSSLTSMEELYAMIKGKRERIKGERTLPAPEAEPRGIHFNLPPIHIPSFDGSADNWPIFYDLFRSNIHLNKQLSSSQKAQYLVSKLSRDALNIVAGVIPSGDTYDIIWSSLVRKYQDKRSLGLRYVNCILEDKSCVNTSKELNKFVEKFAASIAALKQLEIPDLLDFFILHCGLRRLSPQTLHQFETSVKTLEIPSSGDLIEFLRQSVKILERSQGEKDFSKRVYVESTRHQSHKGFKTFVASTSPPPDANCTLCKNKRHLLIGCPKFKELKSPQARSDFIRERRGCFNCLSLSHFAQDCPSKDTCRVCKRKHHTLLHFYKAERKHVAKPVDSIPADNATPSVSLSAGVGFPSSSVLLATAQVYVLNQSHVKCSVRCLIDSGSQNHLITQSCCKRLGLPLMSMRDTSIHGIGDSARPVRGHTSFIIESRLDPSVNYKIKALILDKITNNLPSVHLNDYPSYLKNLTLADPKWNIPGEIDVILGAQLFPQLYLGEKVESGVQAPSLISTTLGYVLMGETVDNKSKDFSPLTFISTKGVDLDNTLQNFFELEEIPSQRFMSPEDQACEDNFNSSSCFKDGRLNVDLPFMRDSADLGDSREAAQRRFTALERKFMRMPELRGKYNRTIQDYLDKGYLEEVPNSALTTMGYYIPHHGVSKPDKEDVRVVLDASAKSRSGLSLNDVLYVGPNLQADLFNLLLGFRLFSVAMTADIRQMFLQIGVNPRHHKYLRILYRFCDKDPVKTYHFVRVPFGLKSSPYLAMRSIRYLADECGHRFGEAGALAASQFYMDDFVHSTSSEQTASETAQNLIDLLKMGSFDLIKWTSNSTELLRKLPESHCSPVFFSDVDKSQDFKILGLSWDPVLDCFSFTTLAIEDRCTKRTILSMVARLFDVLGLVAPVILYAKILIKELWLAKLDWDDVPPDGIVNRYSGLVRDLHNLSTLRIPRHVGIWSNSEVNLVAFCDASMNGYGCCVYIHSTDTFGKISTRLLCAKSKVSPAKVITLARLELVAALLSSKLVRLVINQLSPRVPISGVYIFSDSTVALSWIRSSPHRWSIFVSNRVAKIQENLPSESFYHVAGKENPSDCLSRGMLPSDLITHALWWDGPKWLRQSPKDWPLNFSPVTEEELPEQKRTSLIVIPTEISIVSELARRVSSWEKLVRTSSVILKFVKKYENDSDVIKRQRAENLIVKAVQRTYFKDELELINVGEFPSKKIRNLNAFLDNQGILRVGGRLSKSELPFESKHPILLPKKDPVVDLLIDHYHRQYCHAGPGLLVSIIRQQFWILDGRTVIRSRCRMCNICFRLKPTHPSPIMADLPGCRISEAKAFVHTGVDLAGPLSYVPVRRRGQHALKLYLCLFVCLSTKAIHLELVSNLTTECFIAALKRFISRRGPVSCLYSDNGTNFIGAKAQLNDIYNFLLKRDLQSDVRQELLRSRIEWKLIPPRAPHFGGLWEANIKSVKTHLYRVIGRQLLTYEELLTVLAQVECLLNSRPLCTISSDPHPEVLTPAHFLSASPLKSLPSSELSESDLNLKDRKRLLDQLVLSYWRRWRREYLHTLQVRRKWTTPDEPVTVGMVVLVEQDNVPPLTWPLGLITEVFPGSDGVIRVASVRTSSGSYKRPVVKLYPIPTQ